MALSDDEIALLKAMAHALLVQANNNERTALDLTTAIQINSGLLQNASAEMHEVLRRYIVLNEYAKLASNELAKGAREIATFCQETLGKAPSVIASAPPERVIDPKNLS